MLAQEAVGDLGRGHDLADVVPLLALVLTLLLRGDRQLDLALTVDGDATLSERLGVECAQIHLGADTRQQLLQAGQAVLSALTGQRVVIVDLATLVLTADDAVHHVDHRDTAALGGGELQLLDHGIVGTLGQDLERDVVLNVRQVKDHALGVLVLVLVGSDSGSHQVKVLVHNDSFLTPS